MGTRRFARDDRSVSEAVSVAIMIGLTVLVVATVGISVLTADTDGGGPASANFTFEHFSSNSMLLVTHQQGDSFPAGEIVLEGEAGSFTWAALDANKNETEAVSVGDAVQLSPNSAWGEGVISNENVEIYHVPDPANRTLLDSWRGG